MDLDGILSLILLVLHWRVALCLACSSALAIALVHLFPWLNGLQGIVLAILGLVAGAIWEAQATTPEPANTQKPPETTIGVACASALIAGAMWGVSSASSMHSFLAGAVIFVVVAWGWVWYTGVAQPSVGKERVYLCIILAAFAFPIAAAFAHHAFQVQRRQSSLELNPSVNPNVGRHEYLTPVFS
jgi:hypothetical protein